MKTQVCVIGAGPAGLMAAIAAAENGAKTAIAESNTAAGRKLLCTGRMRCNLTHTGSVDDFVKAYGPSGRFLRHALHEFSADHLRRYFAQQGLQTKVEKPGCVFPVTNRATDVKRVLLDHARRLSVRFLYARPARKITKATDHFLIETNLDRITALSVIIATGGLTWPHTGSTGDGYEFARSFGHTIVQPRACLVRLVTAEPWCGALAGVGIENVVITASLEKRRFRTAGPMLFTANGIGGPAVFDLSRHITDFLPNKAQPVKIKIDLIPHYDSDQLDRHIISLCSANPKKELAGVLSRLLPRSLALRITSQLSASPTLAGRLQKKQRTELVKMLKQLPLSIESTAPIAEATITRGGVSTEEIDRKTMESKLCPGLFFAGEVIDADGPTGGYNLQIAFSTAHLAGTSAARKTITPKTPY